MRIAKHIFLIAEFKKLPQPTRGSRTL